MTMAGPCRVGDSLGVVEGDFAVVGAGEDLAATAIIVVERLLSGGGEMLTLVVGDEPADSMVAAIESYVEASFAGVDVIVYPGGQARYPLLIGVE
jgi:dihydroxyacetone kinase-like predicted kinase